MFLHLGLAHPSACPGAPLEWGQLQPNPVPAAWHGCLCFCSRMEINRSGTLPVCGVAPGCGTVGIRDARGARQGASYPRTALTARPVAFPRHRVRNGAAGCQPSAEAGGGAGREEQRNSRASSEQTKQPAEKLQSLFVSSKDMPQTSYPQNFNAPNSVACSVPAGPALPVARAQWHGDTGASSHQDPKPGGTPRHASRSPGLLLLDPAEHKAWATPGLFIASYK